MQPAQGMALLQTTKCTEHLNSCVSKPAVGQACAHCTPLPIAAWCILIAVRTYFQGAGPRSCSASKVPQADALTCSSQTNQHMLSWGQHSWQPDNVTTTPGVPDAASYADMLLNPP